MKTDNRTVGGKFEQEFAEILAENGFWVHVMQQNKAGQPADIIAVKGKYHTLIDCKVISDSNGFPFEHVQDNQRLAMRAFTKKCGELCYFAFKLTDETIWLINSTRLEMMRDTGKKRLSDKEIRTMTWPLEKWLASSKDWAEDI